LARLRLASVLLDEEAYDEALKQLDGSFNPKFTVRFAESQGDILMAQGKVVEARAAYQTALAKLDEADKSVEERSSLQDKQANGPYREMLQQKRESLGEIK
jgi:predicted negative regulator of RcsB-dependent stress response